MASNDSKFEKVQTDFPALSVVASSLNSASDELSKVIAVLDEALKKLNLGLTVWVVFESHSVEPWQFDDEYIGYCKVNGKWGIALQRAWGANRENDFDREGPWLFNEAPREMRLKSVDAIPKLIEALSSAASEMTKKVQEKTRGVRELTGVIEQIRVPKRRHYHLCSPDVVWDYEPANRPSQDGQQAGRCKPSPN